MTKTLLLLLVVSFSVAAQPKSSSGTWSATVVKAGTTLAGTWEALQDEESPDAVTGTWTVMNEQGDKVAAGTWSARKEGKTWKGAWSARTRSDQLFAGTWQAQTKLAGTADFVEIFEAALADAVGGTWRMGDTHSGAWSIRTYPPR